MTFIGVLYTLATLETEGMRCEVRDIFVRLDILLRPPPAGSFREGVWWREDPSLMLFRTIFARWLDEGFPQPLFIRFPLRVHLVSVEQNTLVPRKSGVNFRRIAAER